MGRANKQKTNTKWQKKVDPKAAAARSARARAAVQARWAKHNRAKTPEQKEEEEQKKRREQLFKAPTKEVKELAVTRKQGVEPTEELIRSLVRLVQDIGATVETACRAMGIHGRMLTEWIKKGMADPDSLYGHFLHQMDVADARHEVATQDDLQRTRDRDRMTKHQWTLERRHSKNWALRKEAVRLTIFEQGLMEGDAAQMVASVNDPSAQQAAEILMVLEGAGVITPGRSRTITVEAEVEEVAAPIVNGPVNG